MVTHDPGVAAWAGRVVFLVDGKVADDLACPTAGLGARADAGAVGLTAVPAAVP